MNLQVDQAYLTAVQGFNWTVQAKAETDLQNDVPEEKELAVAQSDLEALVKQIADKIIAAADLQPKLLQMAGRKLSLLEICIIIVQGQDQRQGITTTVERIQQASALEIKELGRVFQKLLEKSKVDPKLAVLLPKTPDDSEEGLDRLNNFKGAALLFGIQSIHESVKRIIPLPKPDLTPVEETALLLEKMIAIRSQYDAENLPDEQKPMIVEWDAKIEETRQKLAVLKAEKAVNE